MYPTTDNNRILGSSSFRWSTVYAGTGTINTSDATKKKWLGPLPAPVKRALARIRDGIGHFQFLDAVDEKGESARKHIGVTAQDVIAAFEAEGLNPWEWAPICKDPVFETVTETIKGTRKVEKTVQRTRTVQKKVMEEVDVDDAKIEIRDGKPVLVAFKRTEKRPVVDHLPVTDEDGNPVLKDGKPVLYGVPKMQEVEETYTEEVIEDEEFEAEVEEHVATGEFILGLRPDELLWGLLSVGKSA
jgi:hypothetical protein